jgi:hypothetical protein
MHSIMTQGFCHCTTTARIFTLYETGSCIEYIEKRA